MRESGDCVWLELDGKVEARIVWPSGYTATHHPLVVFDAAGHEAFRESNRLSADGGIPRHDQRASEMRHRQAAR